jgi:hypothetical protein
MDLARSIHPRDPQRNIANEIKRLVSRFLAKLMMHKCAEEMICSNDISGIEERTMKILMSTENSGRWIQDRHKQKQFVKDKRSLDDDRLQN